MALNNGVEGAYSIIIAEERISSRDKSHMDHTATKALLLDTTSSPSVFLYWRASSVETRIGILLTTRRKRVDQKIQKILQR